MPTAACMDAATPKCPSRVTEGKSDRRCATAMDWSDRRGVWVCPRHPHMEVRPGEFEVGKLAPAAERDRIGEKT